jgi:hypothetical protein
MDIKTFNSIVPNLPAEIAVLMRGPTGVGKSHVARGVARTLDLPYIDVRGSTMDESDMGIPDMAKSAEVGAYTKMVPSWYLRACREPVVLMLDELNRSMPQVMQSFFQIVLDRELGNLADGEALRLHPDTRVIAAVNFGAEYDVNDMDPALLRRFFVADIEPTADDWVEWATASGLDSILVDFIRQNNVHWRVDPSKVEPGTVTPTPASWHRLSDSLTHMGWEPSKFAGKATPSGFYPTVVGFVGVEAAIAFKQFVTDYELQISAEDILEGHVTADQFTDLPASTKATVIDKLTDNCKANEWTMEQAERVAEFGLNIGGENLVHLWNKISGTANLPNIQKLHKLMGAEVVKVVQASRNLNK